MNKELLIADLDASTESLIQQLETIGQDRFNKQPSHTGWSAAQVAEHLLILEVFANKVVSGETIPSTCPPDSKVPLIKGAMEDMETKRTAPEQVIPSADEKELSHLITAIRAQRDLLKQRITTTDITEACISSKHPALGTLTRLEWIYFTIYHTERHRKQLERMVAMA